MSWKILLKPDICADTSAKNGYIVRNIATIQAPVHPQYATRGHWVMGAPMSKYIIMVEPFGQIEIPSGTVLSAYITTSGQNTYFVVRLITLFDVSTGDCRLECQVKTASGDNFVTFDILTANCAVPVPVHQTMQDAMSFRQARRRNANLQVDTVRGFIDAISNLDIGSAITQGQETIMTAESNIDDATMANKVTVSGDGANGSYMSFNKDLCTPKIICYFTKMVDEYNQDKGRPLCRARQISALSGYILCDTPEISTSGTKQENERIVNYLSGGFFYE